jgi:hypothetical protein
MNIDLFEVCGGGLEDLDVREPYRNIVGKRDPEMVMTSRRFQDFMCRGPGEHGLRRVTDRREAPGARRPRCRPALDNA